MLTLTNSLTIEGYTVFQDDANDFVSVQHGNAQGKLRFYVLPEIPTIAKDEQGQPVFSLVVYRQDEDRIQPANSTQDVGGGILTFTVELSVPDDKFKQIKSALKSRAYGPDSSSDPSLDVDLAYVPFLDGTVSVAVAGEIGGDQSGQEFLKGIVGNGKIGGVGNNRRAVMVKLTQAGAALMSQLQKLRTLPINVQYDLSFEHRLVGVTMRVWCDINSSYTLMQQCLHENRDEWGGYLSMSRDRYDVNKITGVTETRVRNKTAGVDVIPATSEIEPETLASLEKFGLDMLTQEMGKAAEASPPPGDLDRTYLDSYVSTVANNFNFTLDRQMVLVRKFTPSANVSNVFQEGHFEELVSFVDLRTAFFTFLKIPVRVNADFTRLPLDSVTVTLAYQRQRIDGSGREDVISTFGFTDGATIQTFLAFANALADVNYDWEATVHYKGGHDNFTFGAKKVRDEFLVVDVGTLGMVQVDHGLGLVDLDRFPAAIVDFRYQSGALGRMVERQFRLDKSKDQDLWADPVFEEPTKGYEYKVDWLRKDGDILTGQWIRSTASRLRFNAPVPDQLKVAVVCSGNFKDGVNQIGQVAVSLRYRDPDNSYGDEGQLIFTDDKQQLAWTVDLRNPNLRDYQYRYSIIYKDGLVKDMPEDGGWLNGEPGFITVGENYTLRVDVFPALQSYPNNAKLVQVDLTYADAANHVEENDSFVFSQTDNVKRTWYVRGVPGGSKSYTYQVRYYSATGDVKILPPVTTSAEALVVPAPPPPGA